MEEEEEAAADAAETAEVEAGEETLVHKYSC